MSDIKKYILILLQILTIYNATQLGWNVRVDDKKIILNKKIKNMTTIDHNIFKLLSILLNMSECV